MLSAKATGEQTKKIMVYLTGSQWQAFRVESLKRGKYASAMLRDVIGEKLDQWEREEGGGNE